MTIIGNGRRFEKVLFDSESEFEEDIVSSSNVLFGDKIVFINPKKKLESKSLGGVIPDGFFFDFNDPTDPQFYIVEVELISHSFFNHVFPQITKFFAFFKNVKIQKSLVDKLFTVIDTDKHLKSAFRRFLGNAEIYKFLSDIIESSQNILLIANGNFSELQEITDTYTDTWGKLVKFIEIAKYTSSDDYIYTITPDFDTIQYFEPLANPEKNSIEEGIIYTEDFHLEGVTESTRSLYYRIKKITLRIDNGLIFNPQKYYISIRGMKNIAYMKVRKKKIRFIAMLPETEISSIIQYYSVATLSQSVQDFYNGPCAAIDFIDSSHENEIIELLSKLICYHKEEA
jgi:hypothetical protein